MNIQGAAYLHYNFQTFLKIEIDTFAGRHIPGTFVYISKIIHNWIIKKFEASGMIVESMPTF